MSIAHNFRTKWQCVADAADKSRDESGDARYSSMARATEIAGLILTTKEMIDGYQKALEPQFLLLDERDDLVLCIGGRWNGWLFRKHVDGYLVSHRKLAAYTGKVTPDGLLNSIR